MNPKLKALIEKCLTEEARVHMVNFFKKHNDKERLWFWENLYSILEREVNGRMRADDWQPAGIMSEKNLMPISCLGKEISETKFTYEVIQELHEELRNEQGMSIYEDEEWKPENSSNPFFDSIRETSKKNGDTWRIETTDANGNHWNWNNHRRECWAYTVARLIDDDGNVLIFDLPYDDEEPWIHCLMFSIPPEKQKDYWNLKKIFGSAFEALVINTGYRGLWSPCLQRAEGSPKVKSHKLKQKDWRFEKSEDGEDWKLLRLWKRFGFLQPKLHGEDPSKIYLFSPDAALEVKETYLEGGKENPYKNIKCSVYSKEIENKLRM